MQSTSSVYSRVGVDVMTRNAFYFIIGCVLSWGFIGTYIISDMTKNWSPNLFEFLVVGLAIPIIGILMSRSDSSFLSFLGFNLVVLPFGAILGPTLAAYEFATPGVVSESAMLTALVTGVMTVSGLLFPNFYKSIGGALFAALTSLLIILILSMFIPAIGRFDIINYLAAGLFALYIGYDMYRASEIPTTLDNAVDVSISLYLDIINLLLWILKIKGGSRD